MCEYSWSMSRDISISRKVISFLDKPLDAPKQWASAYQLRVSDEKQHFTLRRIIKNDIPNRVGGYVLVLAKKSTKQGEQFRMQIIPSPQRETSLRPVSADQFAVGLLELSRQPEGMIVRPAHD